MRGVITIGGHVQGLGIIRQFGKNGVPCYVLDECGVNIAKHSKYCRKFIKIDEHKDFIQFLIELNSRFDLKDWLLIPTDDNYVRILSQNKKILEKHYRVSVDNWEVIEKCYNKRITYRIAKELDMDIPKTYFPESIKDLENVDLEYPCIIKPAVTHKFYQQSKKKVFLCKDKKELIDNYKKALSYIPGDEVIIQEVIPGDSRNQYSVGLFFNRTEPFITLLLRRKRQYPADFGACSTFVETVKDGNRPKNAEKILKHINFWGICEVEFKKDPRDGKYKFLEINPRTWKHHSIANKSNTPFLMSLYNQIYHNKPIIKSCWEDCCWKDLIIDTVVIFKTLLKGNSIGTSTRGREVQFAVFDTEDIRPFIFELIYAPYLFAMR